MRQNGTEPGRDVFPDVIDLVCVLTRTSGSVLVRLVFQDLHAAALAATLLSALFLQDGRKTTREMDGAERGERIKDLLRALKNVFKKV